MADYKIFKQNKKGDEVDKMDELKKYFDTNTSLTKED